MFGKQLKEYKGFLFWKNEASENNRKMVSEGEDRPKNYLKWSSNNRSKTGWIKSFRLGDEGKDGGGIKVVPSQHRTF